MGDDDLRVLLEDRGDRHDRHALLHRVERLQQVAAHVIVDPPRQHQRAVVHLRAALDDGDVEPALLVGAVGHGLVEAAMLGLGQPVGAERDLGQFLRARLGGSEAQRGRGVKNGACHGSLRVMSGRAFSPLRRMDRLTPTARLRDRRPRPYSVQSGAQRFLFGQSLARLSPRAWRSTPRLRPTRAKETCR